ncbi:CDP-alcohol phosphatidyltransferase family protein [Cohnella sp.]|uniref:CDP-alcohol phosphatidyltransferase family protein n=1 Tax=Cohnella sp. TaxID=1883426 RepID=UPI003565B2E7
MSELNSTWKGKYIRFRNKYVVQQRRQHEYVVNRYYAHLIDPFFTKWAYDLKLSPNTVTIFNGLIGVIAGVFFLLEFWIAGALLLQIHHFLDGADGNLARLTNRCTPFGAKLDQISDQIVRLVIFLSLAISVEVPLWAKIALPLTIFLDVWIVHSFVLPFARKQTLVRSKWKQWFLNKGIIPGVDIFTIFFVISISSFFGWLTYAIYFIILSKNLDWMYRVWECIKTINRNKKEQDTQEV